MLRCQLETAKHQAPPDPLKQLQAIGVAYVQFALNHTSHYRVMFGAYGAMSAQQHPGLGETVRQVLMVLVSSIIAGQQVGIIRSKDPQQLAYAAWALVHGLAMLITFAPGGSRVCGKPCSKRFANRFVKSLENQ